MSVAENVWLGHEPMRLGGIDRRAMRENTAELLTTFADVFSVPVTPDTVVDSLPSSERQLVEVVKALAWRPWVLVLDEATASSTVAKSTGSSNWCAPGAIRAWR